MTCEPVTDFSSFTSQNEEYFVIAPTTLARCMLARDIYKNNIEKAQALMFPHNVFVCKSKRY